MNFHNLNINEQFSTRLQSIMSRYGRKYEFYSLFELVMFLMRPVGTEAKQHSKKVWEEIVAELEVGEDLFSCFSMSSSQKSRSKSSEFYTPSYYSDLVADLLVDKVVRIARFKQTIRVLEPSAGCGSMLLRFVRMVYLRCPELLPRIEFTANELNSTSNEALRLNWQFHQQAGYQLRPLNAVCGDLIDLIGINGFDIVIGNPPFHEQNQFGAIDLLSAVNCPFSMAIERGYVTENGVITEFQRKKVTKRKSLDLAQSCFELGLKALGAGGVIAMILPDSILANSKCYSFRMTLLKSNLGAKGEFELKAVISLPTTAFKHSGTSVKTSIVVMESVSLKSELGCLMGIIDESPWNSRLKENPRFAQQHSMVKQMIDDVFPTH